MKYFKIFFAILMIIFLVSCQDTKREMPDTQMSADTTNGERVAVAVLSPTKGNNVTGKISFIETDEGIRVVARIEGLKPGKHGFHIHENGDCSAPDASSAGSHFAPLGNPHGSPDDTARHTGDMGNIEAGDNGVAEFEWTDSHNLLSFDGNTSIIGKAVIVHEKEDDLKSQPSGNAGNRLACGVIEMQDEMSMEDSLLPDKTKKL